MGLIEVRGVTKLFDREVVLENINLEIPENKIFGIIGINCSGKTTLLKLIAGFYKPNKGEIFYGKQPLQKVLKQLKQDMGFTTQENSFYPKLTVIENIRYFGRLYGLKRKVIEDNLLKVLHLMELQGFEHVLAEHLSGGMKRRLDMACSLIHVPRVLILDEPTEDLDPLLRRDIIRLIKKVNEQKITVIITSHLLDDVELLCDEIAILHRHRVLSVGTMEQLRSFYGIHEEIHVEVASGNYDEILRYIQPAKAVFEDGRLVIYTDRAEDMLELIVGVIKQVHDRLLYLDVRRPSLTEVFSKLTRK